MKISKTQKKFKKHINKTTYSSQTYRIESNNTQTYKKKLITNKKEQMNTQTFFQSLLDQKPCWLTANFQKNLCQQNVLFADRKNKRMISIILPWTPWLENKKRK